MLLVFFSPRYRLELQSHIMKRELTSASDLPGDKLRESVRLPRGETLLEVRPSGVSALRGVLRGDGLLLGLRLRGAGEALFTHNQPLTISEKAQYISIYTYIKQEAEDGKRYRRDKYYLS